MNVLFVHNNFPGQFVHLARALARDEQINMAAIGSSTAGNLKRVKLLKYSTPSGNVAATHPFARRFDLECRRAEQVLYSLSSLASFGFAPDVILAHPGWGESLPLRTIFPSARILAYCEFFYGMDGRDVGFDPEFPPIGVDGQVALHLKNASTLFALADCDRGLAPTAWQRSTFPKEFQRKISVIHEGIDVELVKPAPDAFYQVPSGRTLSLADEVVTYVARNLEPLRGYHTFMRALPRILAERPRAEVIIVGGDGTSYGARPPRGSSWRSIYFNEVANQLDRRRVHFVGRLAYQDYLQVLRISSSHVYLTYPFVVSWSLLEALSVGCVVVASDTAPVREIINGNNGLLVPFFDTDQLADRVIETLAGRHKFKSLRLNARRTILDRYDMERQCLPRLLAFLRSSPVQKVRRAAPKKAVAPAARGARRVQARSRG